MCIRGPAGLFLISAISDSVDTALISLAMLFTTVDILCTMVGITGFAVFAGTNTSPDINKLC